MSSEEQTPTNQIVVFTLHNEEYAVDILQVREIVRLQTIVPVPNTPPFIKGLLNLRGAIIVVIDLQKRFAIEDDTEQTKHIIISSQGDNNFGVCVDAVQEVLRIHQDAIKPTPDIGSGKIHSKYIKGMIVLGEEESEEKDREQKKEAKTKETRLIMLLDLTKLLDKKELLDIQKIAQQTST